MPTEKPRVMVTISQELDDALTEASKATRLSKSALCNELLEGQKMSLKLLTKAHKLLKKPSKRNEKLIEDLIKEKQFLDDQDDLLGAK